MTEEPEWLARARSAYDATHRTPAEIAEVDLDAIEQAAVSEVVSRQQPGSPDGAASEQSIPKPTDEQLAIDPSELIPIHYEHLLDSFSVTVYKRVKRQTMEIATVARELIAEMVGGTVGDGDRSRKEFVTTPRGQYRISMSHMSDNSTEVAAHERMGVAFVHLSDPGEVAEFFQAHGLDGEDAYRRLYNTLRSRIR